MNSVFPDIQYLLFTILPVFIIVTLTIYVIRGLQDSVKNKMKPESIFFGGIILCSIAIIICLIPIVMDAVTYVNEIYVKDYPVIKDGYKTIFDDGLLLYQEICTAIVFLGFMTLSGYVFWGALREKTTSVAVVSGIVATGSFTIMIISLSDAINAVFL